MEEASSRGCEAPQETRKRIIADVARVEPVCEYVCR
jgi:hypothetical protein